jgi:hypothetical protein
MSISLIADDMSWIFLSVFWMIVICFRKVKNSWLLEPCLSRWYRREINYRSRVCTGKTRGENKQRKTWHKGKTDSQDLWLSERQDLQHTTSCWLQKWSIWTSVCISQFILFFSEHGSQTVCICIMHRKHRIGRIAVEPLEI